MSSSGAGPLRPRSRCRLRFRRLVERARGGVLLIGNTHLMDPAGSPCDAEAADALAAALENGPDDLVVVLSGRDGEPGGLLAARPDLARLFPKTARFPDMGEAELVTVFAARAASEGFLLAGGVLDRVRELVAGGPRRRAARQRPADDRAAGADRGPAGPPCHDRQRAGRGRLAGPARPRRRPGDPRPGRPGRAGRRPAGGDRAARRAGHRQARGGAALPRLRRRGTGGDLRGDGGRRRVHRRAGGAGRRPSAASPARPRPALRQRPRDAQPARPRRADLEAAAETNPADDGPGLYL